MTLFSHATVELRSEARHRTTVFILFLSTLVFFALYPHSQSHADITNCREITKLPININRAGVWCLKRNLRYTRTTGAAITVARSNVLIELGGHYISGNQSTATSAVAVRSRNRHNVRVRNGVIEYFRSGVSFTGGFGNEVTNIIFDRNRVCGICLTDATGTILRSNKIMRTGETQEQARVAGIFIDGESFGVRVLDNDIHQARKSIPEHSENLAHGIYAINNVSSIFEDNRISDTPNNDLMVAADSRHNIVSNNRLSGGGWIGGSHSVKRDNLGGDPGIPAINNGVDAGNNFP